MSFNQIREDQHDAHFSGIQKGRVTAVYIDRGEVDVKFEDIPYTRTVTIPLLGLSCPYKMSADDDTYLLGTSWGRYIPQVGDMLLIGFGSNGEAFALGYHAVFYAGLKYLDDTREAKGGIGWGDSSGKRMQPGDWDFKSARSCSMYLGADAKIAAGPHSVALNKTTGDVTLTSGLMQDKYGEAGERRKGAARRFLLPTDAVETYILSLIPGNTGKTAQESYDVVKYGSVAGVPIELTRFHHGEVIDEFTKAPMVPAINASLKPVVLLVGTEVRMLHSVKNPTGLVDVYIDAIDDLGNYGVSAPTATGFNWVTPLATWQINNLVTTYTSATSYSLTSPAITLTGATSIALTGGAITVSGTTSIAMTSPSISALGTVVLGATGGTPLVKGTPALIAAWATYFGAASTAWTSLSIEPTLVASKPSCVAAAAGALALAALLSSSLTTTTTAM